MINKETNRCKHNPEDNISLDALQARLFYLMSQYSMHRCTNLAGAILKEMEALCQHPHIHLLPMQFEMLCKMSNVWRAQAGNRLFQEVNPAIH